MGIPERTKKYKQGLINMIDYIDNIEPVKNMKIVEVGSWTGCSSEIFAKRFEQVICIDIWKQGGGDDLTRKYSMAKVEKLFDERAKKYPGIIFKSKISSLEAAKHYRDFYSLDENETIYTFSDKLKLNHAVWVQVLPDVVYLDAMHDYNSVLTDILAWMDIPTKFICGHDYENRFIGVKKAVRKVFGKPDKVFKDASWIVKIGGKE